MSRVRRVAVRRLRSWNGVRWGREVVAGPELLASAVMGEYLCFGDEALEALEVIASAVLREIVSGTGDVMGRSLEEVVARIRAESSTPIAKELGVVVVVAKLAILASVSLPTCLPNLKGFEVACCACVLPQGRAAELELM